MVRGNHGPLVNGRVVCLEEGEGWRVSWRPEVAFSANGLEEGLGGVGEFFADMGDVHVDRSGFGVTGVEAPDALEDFRAGDNATGVGEEVAEEGGFALGEGCGGVFEGDFLGGEVDEATGDDEGFGGGVAFAGAAEDAVDAGQEFAGGEGFDDVVVRAGGEAANAVGFLATRGEDDDGLAGAVAAEGFEDCKSGEAGEDRVEKEKGVVCGEGEAFSLGAVGGGEDFVAGVGEEVGEAATDGGVVFD